MSEILDHAHIVYIDQSENKIFKNRKCGGKEQGAIWECGARSKEQFRFVLCSWLLSSGSEHSRKGTSYTTCIIFKLFNRSRTLRSGSQKILKISKVDLNSAGKRSFRFQCPAVWNSLPNSIRNTSPFSRFKCDLKT